MNANIRSIRPNDKDEIKLLHEDFFPVRYNDSNYVSACKGIGMFDGKLVTQIAESKDTGEILGYL